MKNFQLIVLTILSFAGLNAQNSGFVQPFEAQEQLNSLVVKNTEYSYAMDETQPASQLLVALVATRLRVKGLYIVPAGQVEKPRAKEAIAAILAIMQSHYLKMLGVTFEFDPEVSVLRSNYSVADAVDWNKTTTS